MPAPHCHNGSCRCVRAALTRAFKCVLYKWVALYISSFRCILSLTDWRYFVVINFALCIYTPIESIFYKFDGLKMKVNTHIAVSFWNFSNYRGSPKWLLSSFRYTFMRYFLYKIDLFFVFFHSRCTKTYFNVFLST